MSDGCLFGRSMRAYLAGAWRIERRIADRRGGRDGSFTGGAVFSAAGARVLHYREDGTLRMDGRAMKASQVYLWRFGGEGADVAFADGRPFHRVAPRTNAATALHDCPPDTYRVAYRFETADRWYQRWIVTGPRKDHTLESVFTRLHPSGDPVHPPPD